MGSKRNLVLIVLAMIIYFIAFIYVLIKIWQPNKTANVKIYNVNFDPETRIVDTYKVEVKRLLSSNNINELFEKLDFDFKSDNNLTIENFESYLTSNRLVNKNPVISDYKISKSEDKYIYRFKYRSNGFERYINLIESRPYEYKISFSQDTVPVSKEVIEKEVMDLYFKFTIEVANESGLKYKMAFMNKGDAKVKFNFASLKNTVLVLKDGTEIELSTNVIDSDVLLEYTKDSSFQKYLDFSINFEKQGEIKSILFKNVLINDELKDVEVNF